MNKYITCDCFATFCENKFEKEKELGIGRTIFCYPEDIKYLFEWLENHPERQVSVVTCGSDFSIVYQKEFPINGDLFKATYGIDYEAAKFAPEYIRMELTTALWEDCNIEDKFSVKMDRYTINTFSKIPDNVTAWYCANANINEDKVKFLPFGMNYQGHGKDIIDTYHKEYDEKFPGLYVNFEVNSLSRIPLKQKYSRLNEPNWLIYNEHVNIEKYYEQMSKCLFTLTPSSNGLDSFRTYESLIVGSIPVMELSRMTINMMEAGFEILAGRDLLNLNPKILNDGFNTLQLNWNRKLLEQEYWKNQIEEAALLC